MKKEKLEEKVELAIIILRATWVIPIIIAVSAVGIVSEEFKRIYYNRFKIPYTAYEKEGFVSYIRLDN
jgi:hypothetical protein